MNLESFWKSFLYKNHLLSTTQNTMKFLNCLFADLQCIIRNLFILDSNCWWFIWEAFISGITVICDKVKKMIPFGNGSSILSIIAPKLSSIWKISKEKKQIIPTGKNINKKDFFPIFKKKRQNSIVNCWKNMFSNLQMCQILQSSVKWLILFQSTRVNNSFDLKWFLW